METTTSTAGTDTATVTTTSPGTTPPTYVKPTGEKCRYQGTAIKNASEYRLDLLTGECKLAQCNPNYSVAGDGLSCLYDEKVATGTKAYNCEENFTIDSTALCTSDNEAGIKWSWTEKGSKEYCSKLISYYEISAYSERDVEMVFRTKVPGNVSQVGIANLPPPYYHQNMTFEIMAYNKDGVKVFTEPFVITLDNKTNRGACSAVGIAPVSAYERWNENDNIGKVTYHNAPGTALITEFLAHDAKGRLNSSGDVVVGHNGAFEIPTTNGAHITSRCVAGFGTLHWNKSIGEMKNRRGHIDTICYNVSLAYLLPGLQGHNDTKYRDVDDPPKKYTSPIARTTT